MYKITYPLLAGLTPQESGSVLTGTVVLTAGTAIIARAPTASRGGGISIAEAFAHIKLGSIATLALVDMGTAGTSVSGTICTLGAAWADAPHAGTPADYWLSAGRYLGLKWSAGTVTAGPASVCVGYVTGRAGV